MNEFYAYIIKMTEEYFSNESVKKEFKKWEKERNNRSKQ